MVSEGLGAALTILLVILLATVLNTELELGHLTQVLKVRRESIDTWLVVILHWKKKVTENLV
jgi:hypothetical protein